MYTVDHPDDIDDIDFNQGLFVSVVNAHTMLMTEIRNNIANSQLNSIKAQCLTRIKPDEDLELHEKIRTTETVNDFIDLLLENSKYCNWLNVDLVETIAIASGKVKLRKLVEKYKHAVHSKTLQEVWEGIPSLSREVKSECCEKIEQYFADRSPSNVKMIELLSNKTLSFEIALLILKIQLATVA